MTEQETKLAADVADYVAACRARRDAFVAANLAWPAAVALNRVALGRDILVAPFNFLMGMPNFVLRLLAGVTGLLRARTLSRRLLRWHLGLPTEVQRVLGERLVTQLLDLPQAVDGTCDPVRLRVAAAAAEPVRIYLQTRNVAADITAGTLVALCGLLLFSQFTPGSISAGATVAQVVADQAAVSDFVFGDVLGRLYYTVFPVEPSLLLRVAILLLVMTVVAIVAAFSGLVHDPVQVWTGIHGRRLDRLLDVIEATATRPDAAVYRPGDVFAGRVYDLIDWVKGLFSLS